MDEIYCHRCGKRKVNKRFHIGFHLKPNKVGHDSTYSFCKVCGPSVEEEILTALSKKES